MSSKNAKTAFVLAAVLMLGLAQAPGFARDLAPIGIDANGTDPNRIDNLMIPLDMQRGGAGVYDRSDPYRTLHGFPRPGWGYLRGMSQARIGASGG